METWHTEVIQQAFKRCYGLDYAIKKAFEGNDTNYQKECLKTLSYQTGLRELFLSDNIKEILQ